MTLKKWNARLALLTTLALFIHAGLMTVAFAIRYYNPVAFGITGSIVGTLFLCHVVLSVIAVFRLHDTSRIAYERMNIGTILQRDCALIMFLLLPLHMKTFTLQQSFPSGVMHVLIIIGQIVFYAALFTHVSLSFPRALITLGWIKRIEVKKRIDCIMGTICVLFFAAINWFIIFA